MHSLLEAGGMNLFPLCSTGLRATKFIYEKQRNMSIETRSAHIYSVLIKSPEFIYGDT
jgi:hypothetical protein